MAFIQTTAPAQADGEVAAMYRRQQATWGYVPNYAKVFCHRTEMLARWGQLLAEIKRPMDTRRFELVTFVAAIELANTSCALAHCRKLRQFLSDDDIVALATDRPCRALTEAEQAMLRFTRQLMRDASKVTPGQVAAMKALGFTDAEVLDIAAVAAGRAFFAKLLDALGVLPDAPLGEIDAALRGPLTVGRPIDLDPCVTMPATAEVHTAARA